MSKKNVEWEWKKLGDLYPISMGKTPPRADKSCWDPKKETNNVWVSIADISANENNVIYDTKEYISNKAAKNITKVEKDSLLLSFKLTIGKMAFAGVPLYTNEAIVNFPPKKGLSLAYLHKYFLYYDWEKSCEGDTKVKGKTLNKEKLKNIDVLLPPLDEQERIVKVLDDAFEKIDAIKTTAETNLQNAKDLFQTTLANELSITDEKIKQGWEEKTLSSIANIISGFAFSSKSFTTSGDYQVIRMGNLKQNEIRLYEKPVFVSNINQNILSKSLLKENDLIVSQTGTKGKRDYGFVARITEKNLLLNQRCACIRFSNKTYFPSLFLYFSYTEHYKNQFFAKEGGTVGQGNVGIDALKNMQIPLPPLSIQKQIVAKLDSLSEKVKQLESNYKQVLADCDELKKALLKQAFEGML